MTEVSKEFRIPAIGTGQVNFRKATRSRVGRPYMRQPVFNWTEKYQYVELKHFEIEVTNIFFTTHYDFSDAEKVLVI